MCSSDWFEVGGSLEKHDVTLDQSKVYGWKPLSIKCDQITPRQSLWSAPVITEYCRHFMWKPDFSVWNVSATQCPQEIPQWNEEAVSNKRALLLASNPTMKCVSVCGWKKKWKKTQNDDQRPTRDLWGEEAGKTGEASCMWWCTSVQKAVSPTAVEDVASEIPLNTFVVLIQID